MARGRPKGSKNKKVASGESTATSSTFRVTLKSLGRVFTGEGNSFEEALEKIKVSGGVKVSSVLTVVNGEMRREKIINGRIAHYLFGGHSSTTREIYLKQVRALFDL